MKRRNKIEISVNALLLAAGVIITIVIISLGIAQLERAKKTNSIVSDSVNDLSNDLQNNAITQYDGLTLTGSEVINFFKKHCGSENDVTVIIKTGTNTTVYDPDGKIAGAGDYNTNKNDIANKSSAKYISPIAKFKCLVGINKNDMVTVVYFDSSNINITDIPATYKTTYKLK